MNSGEALWRDLNRLFTVVCQIDESGQVLRQSKVLAEQLAGTGDNASFFDIFTFKRPTSFDGSFASARSHVGNLFLGFSEQHHFAIRGQLIDFGESGLDGLCFVGVPWLWWVEHNAGETRLNLADFPVHDVQLDQLFFMTTQQTMVEDLQEVNAELQEAKAQVEMTQRERQSYFNHISHEMRTPLNGVISALSLLDDRLHDSQTTELLRLASQGAKRLIDIINFSLESAVVDSDDRQVSDEIFDLDVLVKESLELVAPRAMEKGLQLSRRGLLCFPHWVLGKRRLLMHILSNLLGNAVKFTASGSVSISLRILDQSEDEETVTVELAVADEGPGIPKAQQAFIFEPFQTGDQALSLDEQSTGLGLSIVKRYVEALGGYVSVESTEGVGSVFSISVPLQIAQKPELREQQDRAMTYREWGMRGRVLLVDDMPTNLMLNSALLGRFGLDVISVESGEAAIDLLRNSPAQPDVMLLDMEMPGLSGLQTLHKIRADEALSHVPIIGLSAHNDDASRSQALLSGMDAYLTKPIEMDALVPTLGRWLDVFSREEASDADVAGGSSLIVDGRSDYDHAADSDGDEAMDAGSSASTASGDGAESVFDASVVDALKRDIGVPGLSAAMTSFLTESAKRWDALKAAIANQEKAVIVRESHTIGSACFTFGVMEAGRRMRGIESRAMADEVIDMAALDAIAPPLSRGIAKLQAHIAQ